jgi:hypothetical protein
MYEQMDSSGGPAKGLTAAPYLPVGYSFYFFF